MTEEQVVKLEKEATAASAKAAALFNEIAALEARGMQAGANLLKQYTSALTEAAYATVMHTQALAAYYTKMGKQNREGLGDQRLAALEEQHAEEIELLRQKQATEEEIIQASLNHQLEMEKVKAEESRKIFESQMSTYQTVASNISTAFEAMYDATGESNKAFLAISKAAAIAEAIMNTQVAITKALAEGGPYMGPVLTGVAAASGAAALATIMAQNLATGGVVQGSSPHKRADNIPANLTAGEFVHQVDAVDYYGRDVMQALNQRKIPKTVLQGLMGRVSIPAPPARGNRFSQGGQVTQISNAGGGNTGGQTLELTIVNVMDSKVVDDYMASSNGKARLLNVMGQSSNQFKQVMEL